MDVFRDRADAGARLGARLLHWRGAGPVVLGMPRGGVVVGYQIALALDAPLDVIVCRKLGAPGNEEFGFGAVGPGGVRYVDDRTVAMLGLAPGDVDGIAARELAEMARREECYRRGRPAVKVAGRTVVLADDGLATGATARAAIRAVRAQGAGRLVLAVPVSPVETADLLAVEVDELVCLEKPEFFQAVGQWYQDFRQTEDREVIELLDRAFHRPPVSGPLGTQEAENHESRLHRQRS